MKQFVTLMMIIFLSACSSVTIHDGQQDMIIDGEVMYSGCYVHAPESFTGTVTYKSDTCEVSVNQ